MLALACWSAWARAEDWPRFRGPNGSAVSSETGLPLTWSDSENLAWKVELPGPGSSSPIVSGDRVFVTCYSGYGVGRSSPGDQEKLTRHLVCLNLRDGKLLWQKSVPAKLPEDPYQGQLTEHGYATSTPAADGQRVFAFFGKSGVLAFDREGKLLWQKSVGTGSAMMGWGSGASLLLYKNLVIVNANAEDQSLVALDKENGREVWKAEAKGYSGSWSTPVLAEKADGKQELVVFVPDEVWALDPSDGGVLWYCTGLRGAATTSLVARDGIAYALGGGPRGSGSTAIRAGGRDDVSSSRVLWKQSTGSYVPSPVILGGHMYWVDDRGVAYCLKADAGEQVYRERLPGAGGVYASAVAADGKLYVVTRRNGTFVLSAKPEFKVLAHNRLGADSTDFNASPAVSGGCLLLRSNRCLYCIATK
jgi:outer membrane protein assembly factor BamB